MKRLMELSKTQMQEHIDRHLSHLNRQMPLTDGLAYGMVTMEDGSQALGIRNVETNEFANIHVYMDEELTTEERLCLEEADNDIDEEHTYLVLRMMCVHYWDTQVALMTKQMTVEAACKQLGYEVELIDGDSDYEESPHRCSECNSMIVYVEDNILCPECGWKSVE